MSYLKNEKRKRKPVVRWCVLYLIGIFIGVVFISGLIHLFSCCRHNTSVEATEAVQSCDEVVVSCDEPEVEPEPEPEIISLGEYKLTAYCACMQCCGKTDGITASGVRAKEGVTVAADTRLLPFGTKIIIDGHEYIVQDKGGAIKGKRIDVYFDHHQEALDFGVQYKEVFMKGV